MLQLVHKVTCVDEKKFPNIQLIYFRRLKKNYSLLLYQMGISPEKDLHLRLYENARLQGNIIFKNIHRPYIKKYVKILCCRYIKPKITTKKN